MLLPRHERIRKAITIGIICDFPSIAELVDRYLFEDMCPAICLTCDYIEDQERQETAGWCPVCRTTTLVSTLVLVGLFPFKLPRSDA
jgi:predicted Zn-ribbon and HTH transcriptional regulator